MDLREQYTTWRRNARANSELVELTIRAPRALQSDLRFYSITAKRTGIGLLISGLMLESMLSGIILGLLVFAVGYGSPVPGLLFFGAIAGFLVMWTRQEFEHKRASKFFAEEVQKVN